MALTLVALVDGIRKYEARLTGSDHDNNPNGVSFSPSAARRWWEVVFRDRLNISRVRPTLMPGSFVLSPEGVAEASALGVSSIDYAPEDFNPLGLPVIA